MSFENEASRLRKLAQNRNISFLWTGHAEVERNKDQIAKIDVHNMLKRCLVSNVEDSDGETGWRAEGTDIDGRRICAIVVVYEDDGNPEIKIVTTWAKK
jgi:hypothetical protein